MVTVTMGAITKNISKGALKWYLEAGWKVLKEEKEEKNDKTDTKKTTTT